ncbi:hypothetical protein [Propionivibrio limicola]|uniref:hypothetical protein n=1 Tax=Propionivibrio limicola TaxID=167645 RepID=UPI001290ED18|nr:hypothetical protein [Propionivibrio limicola]
MTDTPSSTPLSLGGLLRRFAMTYLLCLVGGILLLPYFVSQRISVISAALLLAAVIHACMGFRQKNGRNLSRREKWLAWAGIMGIDLIVLALLPALLLAGTPSTQFVERWIAMLGSAGLVVIVHAATALLGISLAQRIKPHVARPFFF